MRFADQRMSRFVAGLEAGAARLSARWQKVSDYDRKRYLSRAGISLSCALALTAGLTLISARFEAREAADTYRHKVTALAQSADAGAALRASQKTSPLLEHSWLQRVDYSLDQEPRTALTRYGKSERDLAILASMSVKAPARIVEKAALTHTSHKCLAEAVYYEARSESSQGQLAVAEVIMNRVADHRYPNSVCEVVYQGAHRNTGCQFTFTCDGATDRAPRGLRWERAQSIAAHVLLDLNEKRTGAATHYHATYVDPVWNAGLIRTDRIGTHIFYRFPRGGEWAKVRNAVAIKRAARRAALVQKASSPAQAASSAEAPKTISPTPAGLSVLSPAP